MHPIARPAVLLAALVAGGSAFAVPFSVEGQLTAISSSDMTCNSVQVVTNAATVFSTPSGIVPQEKLLSSTPFVRNPLNSPAGQSAFIGGACIVSGEELPATGRLASDVFVAIRENLLVGPITRQSPFSIMGVEIVLLTTQNEPEGRIVAGPPVNALGLDVELDTVPLGDESFAEGYMGSDGKFYAHAVQTGAARTQSVLVTVDSGVGPGGSPVFVNPPTRAAPTLARARVTTPSSGVAAFPWSPTFTMTVR